MSREEKLFRNENSVLEHFQAVAASKASYDETHAALVELTRKYENLLDQARFLTWISGRLERKLQRKNKELQNSNGTLRKTLKELTLAEAGKIANAIIYTIAIVLFVLEEFFVEPVVNSFGDNVGYGIIVKLFIVILLKISEGFIEKRIVQYRRLKTIRSNQLVTT